MSSSRSPRAAWAALRHWPRRRWIAAAVAMPLVILVVGVPTALVPNPFFSRSVPPVWWNHIVLVLTALLSAVVLATYVRTDSSPRDDRERTGRSLGSASVLPSLFSGKQRARAGSSHGTSPQPRFLLREAALALVGIRQGPPEQPAEGRTVPGRPQMTQFVDEDQVDQRRRQLQDGPVDGDRSIRSAGPPAGTQVTHFQCFR